MLTDDRVRVAVFVSGGGTNLQALLDASKYGQLPSAEIALVIADRPDAGALERAASAGVVGAVVAPGKMFTERLREVLSSHMIEMVVLAGYLQKIPEAIVDRYEGRMINIHPSLLPKFGGKGWYGLRVHRGVLEQGEKATGATVHVVTAEFDDGPIILQKSVDVRDGDTPESLQERVKVEAEWQILPAATEQVAAEIVAGQR